MNKQCTSCKEVKAEFCFYAQANRKDGLSYRCKECISLLAATWQTQNKERAAINKQRYNENNRQRVAATNRRIRQSNPSAQRAYLAKKRAAKLVRTASWADKNAMSMWYQVATVLSRGGVKFHVDHIIPLQGKTVSGLHVENNMQVLPAYINISKHNRFDAEKI